MNGFEKCQKMLKGVLENEKFSEHEKILKIRVIADMNYQEPPSPDGPTRHNQLKSGGEFRPSA